jgi:hypothetical protein
MFELAIEIRNAKGEPTGKKKVIKTDSADTLSDFWDRHQTRKPRKKKVERALPSASEAEKLAKDVGTYAEEKQQTRDNDTE